MSTRIFTPICFLTQIGRIDCFCKIRIYACTFTNGSPILSCFTCNVTILHIISFQIIQISLYATINNTSGSRLSFSPYILCHIKAGIFTNTISCLVSHLFTVRYRMRSKHFHSARFLGRIYWYKIAFTKHKQLKTVIAIGLHIIQCSIPLIRCCATGRIPRQTILHQEAFNIAFQQAMIRTGRNPCRGAMHDRETTGFCILTPEQHFVIAA